MANGSKHETFLKGSVDKKCGCNSNAGHPNNGACNTSAVQAALGPGLLLGPIHGVSYDL